jgi:hypothetical protein
MMRKPIQDFFLFLVGGALFAAGIFLFTNQVMVTLASVEWGGEEVTVAVWGHPLVGCSHLALAKVLDC